jgi:hypothetical protein
VARTISITSGAPAATPVPVNPAKVYPVNINVDSGPMKLNISKVTLDPAFKKNAYSQVYNTVVLDVTVENTSTDTVSWYPGYGTAVFNTKEQVTGDLYNSDQVGGDFIGKVIKTGKIVFVVKSDLKEINNISLVIDGPFGANYTSVGEKTTTEILLN